MDVFSVVDATGFSKTTPVFSHDPSTYRTDIQITKISMILTPISGFLSSSHQDFKGISLPFRHLGEDFLLCFFAFFNDPVFFCIQWKDIPCHQHPDLLDRQTGLFNPGRGIIGMHTLAPPPMILKESAVFLVLEVVGKCGPGAVRWQE